MAVYLRKSQIAKAVRDSSKCEVIQFVTKSGEVIPAACRRRSCPICWPSWAWHTATALLISEAIASITYSGAWLHIILTVNDKHINLFPTEQDYINGTSKDKIHFSGRAVSEFTRTLRVLHGSRTSPFPAFGRVLEFGEKNTKRFHVHYITYIHNDLIPHDKNGLGFIINSPIDWPYGFIRTKLLNNGPRGLRYLAAYTAKQTYGRFSLDRRTSRIRRVLYQLTASKCGTEEVLFPVPVDASVKMNTRMNRQFVKNFTEELRNGHLRVHDYLTTTQLREAIEHAYNESRRYRNRDESTARNTQ